MIEGPGLFDEEPPAEVGGPAARTARRPPILEIVLKVIALDFAPWRFFGSGWNNFDLFIVLGSFDGVMPFKGNMLPMLRLLRLLRRDLDVVNSSSASGAPPKGWIVDAVNMPLSRSKPSYAAEIFPSLSNALGGRDMRW